MGASPVAQFAVRVTNVLGASGAMGLELGKAAIAQSPGCVPAGRLNADPASNTRIILSTARARCLKICSQMNRICCYSAPGRPLQTNYRRKPEGNHG